MEVEINCGVGDRLKQGEEDSGFNILLDEKSPVVDPRLSNLSISVKKLLTSHLMLFTLTKSRIWQTTQISIRGMSNDADHHRSLGRPTANRTLGFLRPRILQSWDCCTLDALSLEALPN